MSSATPPSDSGLRLTGLTTSATTSERRGGPWRLARREALAGYLFVSPALLLFLVFIAGPLCGAIVLSFYQWDLLTPAHYVGLQNYRDLFRDEEARTTIVNSFVFTFWSIVLHLGLGLALALAVNRAMPGVLRYALRTAFFFPLLISWAAVSLIWLYILDPSFGFFNYYLAKTGLTTESWLVSPTWAMPAIILVDLWHTIGFTFIILVAGLQGVPSHLYEAAMIDGAGPVRRFWNVTIPMLTPTLFFVVVINFIGAFQIFEPMFIMTQGGPGDATKSIVFEIFETGFRSFEMGYASAMALVVFVVIMAVTLLQLGLSRYWVHHD